MFSAKSLAIVRAFAIVAGGLLALFLSTSIALAQNTVPKAICGPADHAESGLQGQTTPQERLSGDSERPYNCNLELVGQYRGEGAYSQDGPTYDGICAYYATDNVTALQQHLGVTVIDASDPQHPQPTAYLDNTPAALSPHETLRHHHGRNLLAVAQFNGSNFAVYDTSAGCRNPVLKASIQLPGSSGHMGNFTPDGLTYYVGQSNRGIGGFVYIVDLTDPSSPQELPRWQFLGDGRPHGIWFNADGTLLYAGQPGLFGNTGSSIGPDGLVIDDVSDYQFRLPNPQIRIVSKLFWDDQGQVEEMHPFSMHGRQYVVSSDESGGAGGVGGLPAACARGASPFGYPNIIDVTDPGNPFIVVKLKLQVSDNSSCPVLLNDPPDVGAGIPAYNEERCVPNRYNNPTMLACGFQNAGLRVFDIRDLEHPREIAYYKPGAPRTTFLPGSGSWGPKVDLTVDRLAGYARFYTRVPGNGKANGVGNGIGQGNGNGTQLEIWTVSDGNGFQILRFTDNFKAQHKDLFQDSGE